ncbi:MAG: tRNA (adenosine(37)-N6)-threonylcarbamoyltransferase complex ATPase subunit type 1 TsaE [Xanthomonadales bacterium]|nr:tRNA (adenosine(37)-N6)-threonylcarbamoyltransferase complex ATPase subunit type 1 TsaE [Xanthomonadales bacterium]
MKIKSADTTVAAPTGLMCCHCPLEADTRRLAAELAVAIRRLYLQRRKADKDFTAGIWLQGDLGAGKTTLARELLQSLGVKDRIKSPTYALLEEYRATATATADSVENSLIADLPLLHLDLYRLADAGELEYLGVPEALAGALTLIEWPQQGEGWLPTADLLIRIEEQASGRMFILQAQSATGEKLLENLSSCF